MAKLQSERTLKMKRSFIELHNQGLGVYEIAERFNLNPVTVYASLEEIAAAAGVTRDSLLKYPHSPHFGYSRQNGYQKFSEVNLSNHQQYVQKTLEEFDQTISTIDQYITVQEEIQTEEGKSC